MVAARMGVPPLPHWVVESVERRGLVVTTKTTERCAQWSRLYAACADGDQRQAVTEAFIQLDAGSPECLPLCGAWSDHFRCTHSEAGITAAPVTKAVVGLLMPDGKINQ